MADGVVTPPTVLNPFSGEIALNMKQLVDDNQEHSRRRASNDSDFDKALNLFHLTELKDSQTLKHLAAINLLTASQTGETEDQQTVSPVRTGTGDALVGSIGVSADTVAASQANLLTSTIPVIASALATAISQTIAAVLPALVTAIGGASTPSQTTAKAPTSAS